MLSIRTPLLLLAVGLVALAGLPLAGAGAQDRGALAVVVGQHTPVDELSLAELRRVFLGQAVEKGGVKLIPLNHAINSTPRTLFDRVVLKMSPDEVGRYWVAQRIRGARSAPKSVSSTALLLKVVGKIKGAISYVPTSEVRSGLKMLRVDGHSPGAAGYPIAQ